LAHFFAEPGSCVPGEEGRILGQAPPHIFAEPGELAAGFAAGEMPLCQAGQRLSGVERPGDLPFMDKAQHL
jgi:hypothetical protein